MSHVRLSKHSAQQGGTRVWPRTHLDETREIVPERGYIDTIEPLLNVGDALVFDGLLCHCGMENLSGLIDDFPRDRFFYYAAFSSTHDPNTDVTGW
jgi:ectoine hydroxylase-related dioxygenase (phytanoyl-CoA dioxygenase family)